MKRLRNVNGNTTYIYKEISFITILDVMTHRQSIANAPREDFYGRLHMNIDVHEIKQVVNILHVHRPLIDCISSYPTHAPLATTHALTTMHASNNHACPPHHACPPATMHAPSNHPHPPATTHAPINHAHPHPPSNHALPPGNHTHLLATTHTPPQPCMPPPWTDRHL